MTYRALHPAMLRVPKLSLTQSGKGDATVTDPCPSQTRISQMPMQRAKRPFSGETLQLTLMRVLRPLVKLALASGLSFPSFASLLKRLYVDVAERDFALADKAQTDSRISLLTGVHRKDVSRLRDEPLSETTLPAAVSQTGRIIAKWIADPLYCNEDGSPRVLPRTLQGEGPSFERLVAEITKDVHPRAVLDEWVDRGIVSVDAQDMVRLDLASIVPNADDEARRHYFTRNLHDHALAAVSNVINDVAPHLERAVHYDRISADLAARLDVIAREETMAMLLRLNKIAHQLVQEDPGGGSRWIAGGYVLTETVETSPLPRSGTSEAKQ